MQLTKIYTAKMSCISCIHSATYLLTISLPVILYNVSVLPYVRMFCMVVLTVVLSCNQVAGCVTGCPITHPDMAYVKYMHVRLFGSCAISFSSRAADRFGDVYTTWLSFRSTLSLLSLLMGSGTKVLPSIDPFTANNQQSKVSW